MKIKIGIAGYGNLGRGVEAAVLQNPDMELYGVFTRRNPNELKTLTDVPAYSLNDIIYLWYLIAISYFRGNNYILCLQALQNSLSDLRGWRG